MKPLSMIETLRPRTRTADCHLVGRPTSVSLHKSGAQALETFISAVDFPCLGAKAALAHSQIRMIDAGDLQSADHDQAIVAQLQQFASHAEADTLFVSFVVLFAPAPILSEFVFEQALWQRLQSMHAIDRRQFDWDPRVSCDPKSAHFSLSMGGKGFFVIGLHPGASRPARRFRQPALVFNLHSQFEQLRSDGRYEKLRAAIIARDVALAGSPNPMLAIHGRESQARQYSGRQVDSGWSCPFHALLRSERA
ncbi:MAG: guanitoxin biosynthesis heme-dependent pre-guanitoxin N-hydroxylase GntA [Rhodanobacter sp.]